jgi:hypothetical protein
MSSYLDTLRAEISQNSPGSELSKLTKPGFGSFGSALTGGISKNRPPLDSTGNPYCACPSCGQGEFWRPSKLYHPDTFNPRDWRCSSCERPQMPCDHCGVPTTIGGSTNVS